MQQEGRHLPHFTKGITFPKLIFKYSSSCHIGLTIRSDPYHTDNPFQDSNWEGLGQDLSFCMSWNATGDFDYHPVLVTTELFYITAILKNELYTYICELSEQWHRLIKTLPKILSKNPSTDLRESPFYRQ